MQLEDFPDCCDWHIEEHYTQHSTIGKPAGQRIHIVHSVGCEWAIELVKQQEEADDSIAIDEYEKAIERGEFDEA